MQRRRLFIRGAAAFAVVASTALAPVAAYGKTTSPDLSITVAIGDVSAEAPGPDQPEGTPFTFVFAITNTGTETLSGLALTDDVLGSIECPATTLEAGQAMICERSSEAVAGKFRSTSVVSAVRPDGIEVQSDIRLGYKGLRLAWVAALDVDVLLDGLASNWPGPTLVTGDQVAITYRVLNEGTVPLERIKVFDPDGLKVTCPVRTVTPGSAVECTAVGTVIEGRFKEKVVVRAWDARGDRIQDVQRFHYLGEMPVLTASFDATPFAGGGQAAAGPGPRVPADTSIAWSVEIVNTGEDDLWSLYVRDGEEGRMECGTRHLAPGASTHCMVWGWAVAGPMTGWIDISAWASDGRHLSERLGRHAFGFRPGADVLLETYVDGFDADEHAGPRRVDGDALDLTYAVHNTGTESLRQIKVTDSLFGSITCPSRFLAPGATMVCSHTETAELGWWETAGIVKARSGGQILRDADKTFWHVRPVARVSRIHLAVTIGGFNASSRPGPSWVAGTEVEVVYVATNTGNSPLWSLGIRDPNVPEEDMVCSGSSDPSSGAALTCRATIVIEVGDHWEEIEAVAWNSDGTRIVGKDAIYYVGAAGPT